jgi:SAM-dependent methyltransferase
MGGPCCITGVGTRSLSAELFLTPARRRGHEILDDPSHDPALAARSLRDVALANTLFGGRRAILREVGMVLDALARSVHENSALAPAHAPSGHASPRTLLDVGTGLGDIPAAAADMARRRGVTMETIGVELAPALAKAAQSRCTVAVASDAMALPFANASVDIITCSQVLHHFADDQAARLVRECTRVARHAVIIGDLRRSWLAVAGLWASSFALGFHPVSRHDGIVSILRGYTRPELHTLIERATGRPPTVRHALGWRVTATWTPRLSPTS